jgi:hypothetical protein
LKDEAWWRFPLHEKKGTYWSPPVGFDPDTGGRVLSDEERKILMRLNREDKQ